MKKRMFLMLVAIVVFLTAIGAVKYGQIKKGMAQQASYHPPPEAVTTVVAKTEQWPTTLSAIGTVDGRPRRGGQRRPARDRREDLLRVRPDRARRRRPRAARHEAGAGAAGRRRGAARAHPAEPGPPDAPRGDRGSAAQADLDTAEARLKEADAKVGEIRATIERKTIRAPFTGVLGIRQVNLGQYLQAGKPRRAAAVAATRSTSTSRCRSRSSRRLQGRRRGEASRAAESRASRRRARSPRSTRSSIRRRATSRSRRPSQNADGKLRPGMFVETNVGVGSVHDVITLPASADQLRAVRRLGLRRRGDEGSRRARPTRASASSSSSWGPGAATRSRSSRA